MLRTYPKKPKKVSAKRLGRIMPAIRREAEAAAESKVEAPKPYVIFDPSGGNYELQTNIPKIWMQTSDLKRWGFSLTVSLDVKRNLSDATNDEYWETWEFVLREALLIDSKGVQWILQEDEERRLWATPR
jgi:hypothetical protein